MSLPGLQVVETLKAENYNCMLAKTDPYTHGVLRNADLEVPTWIAGSTLHCGRLAVNLALWIPSCRSDGTWRGAADGH